MSDYSIDVHVCWNSNRRLMFIVCRRRKTNFSFPFPFAAIKRKFAVSVFHLQQTNGNCCFHSVSVFVWGEVVGVCVYLQYTFIYIYIYI
jgi:hypothetical protein